MKREPRPADVQRRLQRLRELYEPMTGREARALLEPPRPVSLGPGAVGRRLADLRALAELAAHVRRRG